MNRVVKLSLSGLVRCRNWSPNHLSWAGQTTLTAQVCPHRTCRIIPSLVEKPLALKGKTVLGTGHPCSQGRTPRTTIDILTQDSTTKMPIGPTPWVIQTPTGPIKDQIGPLFKTPMCPMAGVLREAHREVQGQIFPWMDMGHCLEAQQGFKVNSIGHRTQILLEILIQEYKVVVKEGQ